MTPQEEAFNVWGESVGSFGFDYLEVWNEACKWQRKQDAKICYDKYNQHVLNGFPREASTARVLGETILNEEDRK